MSWEITKHAVKLKLSPGEKLTLMVMADHVPTGGRRCYPGVARMALMTGFSERKVQRALKSLRQKNIIATIADEKGGRSLKPKYEIRVENGDLSSPFSQERVTANAGKGAKTEAERVTHCHPNLNTNLKENLSLKGDSLAPNYNGNDAANPQFSNSSLEDLRIIEKLNRSRKQSTAAVRKEIERRTM